MNDFPGNPYEAEELRAQVEALQKANAELQDELKHRESVLSQFMNLSGVGEFYDPGWWKNSAFDDRLVQAFVDASDAVASTRNLQKVMKAIKDNEMLNAQWLKLLAMMRITE